MRLRRLLALVAGIAALAAVVVPAVADPYPLLEEPVLGPDTKWVAEPWGYRDKALTFVAGPYAGRWPTILTMEGYAGASRPEPNAYLRMDDGELMALRIRFGQGPRGDYAFVQASIRGTECSGGHFNLYDRRHAWDGYHIIEWIAAQPWSNERVGMFGSSFPGQTAYWTAATQPPHLAAVSANLLHSDIYRDIFMPGGVQNILFPSAWTYAAGPHRAPQDSIEEGTIPEDEICTQHQAIRYQPGDLPQAQNEPAWAALRSVDDDWYVGHAAITYAPAIKIPFYLQNNWQDEQVGPRSVVLWHHIHPEPRTIVDCDGNRVTVEPKKFVLASGSHGHGGYAGRDRWDWLDIWLLDRPDCFGPATARYRMLDHRVVNFFEAQGNGSATATKSGDAWPFPGTRWDRIYLHADGSIGLTAPSQPEDGRDYLSGAARQGFLYYTPDAGQPVNTAEGLPDMLTYTSEPLQQDIVVAGPILMDLYAKVAGTDADFFVSVNEQWPDRKLSYLQRGLLKASHRRVDPLRSYYSDGLLVQPYRPHTNPQPLVPGDVYDFQIEIFPLGHIFRAGNRIQINVHTPPMVDGLWGYTPTHHQPAAVTVLHGSQYPTSIQLPVVTADASYGAGPGCQIPDGFPCYAPPSKVGP